jgi:amidase
MRAHLDQIRALEPEIGAFHLVRAERALAEAEALATRRDLGDLPLAGVPLGVKDNLPVQGEPLRRGTRATAETPSPAGHQTVRRLRAAGALVVGKTALPELGVWGTTDAVFGVTRNPWDQRRTAGGSSGGSAAAVSAAMIPIALGNDALGSIRIPAAACGVVGMKPGAGVVPAEIGGSGWFGLSENGPLATTVDDAALMLSVLADRPDLRAATIADHPLRVAAATASPIVGIPVAAAIRAATLATARVLANLGHRVAEDNPPYPVWLGNATIAWWTVAVAEEVDALDPRLLEPRTLAHARLGRIIRRMGLRREGDRQEWRLTVGAWFANYDLVVLPTLAQPPIDVGPWSRRSWLANVIANTRFAPMTGPWNFAGYPALSIPAGQDLAGRPIGVQLVGKPNSEALLLAVARQLEASQPWPRHAPVAGLASQRMAQPNQARPAPRVTPPTT